MRDDEVCGRERDVRISQQIEKILRFLDEDRRVCIKTIGKQYDVGMATLNRTIHKDLNMLKNGAKFVPREFSDEQMERRVGDKGR